MARTRIDLNRFKKVYPLMRRSPHWYTQNVEAHGFSVSFVDENDKTVETTDVNSPVVVITGVGSNVNVNIWVHQLTRNSSTGVWSVRIKSSAAFTGDVHIVVTEGAP
jgi:hypothetical protein